MLTFLMIALLAEISNLQLLIGAGVVMLASTVMTNLFMSRLNSDSLDDSEEAGASEENRSEGLGQGAANSKVGTPRARRIQPTQGGEADAGTLNPLPTGSGMLTPSGLATAGAQAFAKPTELSKEIKPGASLGTEITSKPDIAAALAGFSPASKDAPSNPEAKKETGSPTSMPPLASLVEIKTPVEKPAQPVELPPLAVSGPTPASSIGSLPPLGSLTVPAKSPDESKAPSATVPTPASVVPTAGLVVLPPAGIPSTDKPAEKPVVSDTPVAASAGENLVPSDKPVTAGANPPLESADDVKKQKTPPPSDKLESSAAGLILIPPMPSANATAAAATSSPVTITPVELTVPVAKVEPEPEPKSTGRPRIFMPANQPSGATKSVADKGSEPIAPESVPTPAAVEAVPEIPAALAPAKPAEAVTVVPAPDRPEPVTSKPASEPLPAAPTKAEPAATEDKSDAPAIAPTASLVKPASSSAPTAPSGSLIASMKSVFADAFGTSKPEPVAAKTEAAPAIIESAGKAETAAAKAEGAIVTKPENSPVKSDSVAQTEVAPARIEPAATKTVELSSPVKSELVAAKTDEVPGKSEPVATKSEPKKEEQPQSLSTMLIAPKSPATAKQGLPPEDGTPGAPLASPATELSIKPVNLPTELGSKPVTPAVAAPASESATPAPAVSVPTSQPKMALTESTTNVPANARAAAQLTLGFEITSLQLTPFFKLGAVQLRPLSNIVSLHLIASQAADNPLAAGISFQIVTVELNEAQHLRSILLKPLPQSQPSAVPQPKLQVDTVQIGRGGENAPIQITSSDQTSTAVQLIADFTIAAMDFTPSFEIGSLRLEPTSNSVLLRLAASQKPTALDLPPSFEVANVQLAGDAQFAGVRLTPGTAPKPA